MLQEKWKNLLQCSLKKIIYIKAKEADAAKEEFERFQNKVVKKNREKFESFDTVLQRLDTFYLDSIPDIMTRYVNLWKVMVFVFSLSHGQVQVERGFSINSECTTENMVLTVSNLNL